LGKSFLQAIAIACKKVALSVVQGTLLQSLLRASIIPLQVKVFFTHSSNLNQRSKNS
jgi:hypothetical protein